MKSKEIDLLNLGLEESCRGTFYWLDALEIIKNSKKTRTMTQLYTEIAEKNETNIGSVERAMARSLENSQSKLKKELNYEKKITNRIFTKILEYRSR